MFRAFLDWSEDRGIDALRLAFRSACRLADGLASALEHWDDYAMGAVILGMITFYAGATVFSCVALAATAVILLA